MNPPVSSDKVSLRPFFTLWVGQAVSLLGSQLVQFALIWWLTQETGSATVLAGASIVGLLPNVVLGPFVGVLIDRWNRRRVMLGADLAVAMMTAVLAYLFWTGTVEIWHVYLALFVRALGGAFHWPAMTASTSLMVPQEQLTRIQGLNQMLNGGLNIASAPLGALLVTLLPIQQVLLIDLFTAAFAIATILIVYIPQPELEPQRSGDPKSSLASYLEDLRAGLRYVLNWRGLMMLAVVAMLINLVLSPTTSFMPLLVTEHFNGTAWHLGALEAGFGIGVLLGGILLGVWGGFRRRIITSLLGVFGIGLGILLVGLTPAALFPVAVIGMLVGGVMSSLANGPIMAIFQANVAPNMQGRVFTLMGSGSAAMMPLGLALAGPLAESIGVRTWFIVGGTITLLLSATCYFIPSLMNIEQMRDDHPEETDRSLAGPATPVLDRVEGV